MAARHSDGRKVRQRDLRGVRGGRARRRADLAQVDARVEAARELPHQGAEVDAVRRGEVEDDQLLRRGGRVLVDQLACRRPRLDLARYVGWNTAAT